MRPNAGSRCGRASAMPTWPRPGPPRGLACTLQAWRRASAWVCRTGSSSVVISLFAALGEARYDEVMAPRRRRPDGGAAQAAVANRAAPRHGDLAPGRRLGTDAPARDRGGRAEPVLGAAPRPERARRDNLRPRRARRRARARISSSPRASGSSTASARAGAWASRRAPCRRSGSESPICASPTPRSPWRGSGTRAGSAGHGGAAQSQVRPRRGAPPRPRWDGRGLRRLDDRRGGLLAPGRDQADSQ